MLSYQLRNCPPAPETPVRREVAPLTLRGLQCFIAHSEVPIVAAYPSGTVIAVNNEMLSLLGKPVEDVLGESLFEVTNGAIAEYIVSDEGVYSFDYLERGVDIKVIIIAPENCRLE
jgi:PAS domain-containing protein